MGVFCGGRGHRVRLAVNVQSRVRWNKVGVDLILYISLSILLTRNVLHSVYVNYKRDAYTQGDQCYISSKAIVCNYELINRCST